MTYDNAGSNQGGHSLFQSKKTDFYQTFGSFLTLKKQTFAGFLYC